MKKLCILVLCLSSCITADDKQLLGGYTQVAVNDAYVADVIPKVVDLFSQTHKGYVFIKSHKAGYQIVAGTNYYFALQFRHNEQKVMVKLYAHKTLNGEVSIVEIISIDKSTLGGYSSLKKDSSEAKDVIAKVTAILKKRDCVVVDTNSVAKQIVAGTNYYMEMQLSCHNVQLLHKLYVHKALDGHISINNIEGIISDTDSLAKIMQSLCVSMRSKAMSSKKICYVVVARSPHRFKVTKDVFTYLISDIVHIKPEANVIAYRFDAQGNVSLVGGANIDQVLKKPQQTYKKANVTFVAQKQNCLFSIDEQGKVQYQIQSN